MCTSEMEEKSVYRVSFHEKCILILFENIFNGTLME